MERAGRALANAASALDAQINKHKAQEEAAEVKHVMNFVMAIARAAPLAPQAETDRLASASENFSSLLERVAFVAGDLKKVPSISYYDVSSEYLVPLGPDPSRSSSPRSPRNDHNQISS